MNKITLIISLLFGFWIPFIWGQASSDWQKYEDSSGRYSVLFPEGGVHQHLDTIETPLGRVVYNTAFYHRGEEEGVSIYKVSWCDYPSGSIPEDSVTMRDAFFDATIETAAESVQGELVYQSEEKLSSFSGRSWRINYNKGHAVLHSTAYLINNRYYLLQSASPRSYSLSPEIEKFFSSFRLIE